MTDDPDAIYYGSSVWESPAFTRGIVVSIVSEQKLILIADIFKDGGYTIGRHPESDLMTLEELKVFLKDWKHVGFARDIYQANIERAFELGRTCEEAVA